MKSKEALELLVNNLDQAKLKQIKGDDYALEEEDTPF